MPYGGRNHGAYGGAGAWVSSALDLVRIGKALNDDLRLPSLQVYPPPTLLRPDLIRQMFTDQWGGLTLSLDGTARLPCAIQYPDPTAHRGLGFGTDRYVAGAVGHEGTWTGSQSLLLRLPEEGYRGQSSAADGAWICLLFNKDADSWCTESATGDRRSAHYGKLINELISGSSAVLRDLVDWGEHDAVDDLWPEVDALTYNAHANPYLDRSRRI